MINVIVIDADLDDELDDLKAAAEEADKDELKKAATELCHRAWREQFGGAEKVCIWFGPRGPRITPWLKPLTYLGDPNLLGDLAALDARLLGDASGSRRSVWVERPQKPYYLDDSL